MCLTLLWKDLYRTIKTCKLKSQLLLCYVTSISLVMAGLILVLYISLSALETYTNDEIESTLSDVRKKNSQDFVSEYSRGIWSQLQNVGMLVGYMNYYMLNLQNSSNDSPFMMPSITPFANLPSDCTMRLTQYDNAYVCLNYSSSYSITNNNVTPVFTRTLGYLAYIFPDIFTLLTPIIHRILIYIPTEEQLIVFPGQQIPLEYNISESTWKNGFNSTPESPFTFIALYSDALNIDFQVVSLVQSMEVLPEFQITGQVLMNAEIQGSALYALFPNTNLTDPEIKIITDKYGNIINSTFFNSENKISNYSPDLWDEIQQLKYEENIFHLYNNSFYRMSFQSVPVGATSLDEVWLFVFLITKERDVMKYRNESQANLQQPSYILLGLTAGIALIIITVSAIIIDFTGKSIAKPLVGIKTLTDRIYAGEKNIENELELLEEGTERVAELVRAFKSLANTISHRRHAEVPNRGKKKVYPPNELYQTNRILWRASLNKIPN